MLRLLTSNLPVSKWEGIFKDPMPPAAAIDRLVHHSVIVELNIPSYRMTEAKKNRDLLCLREIELLQRFHARQLRISDTVIDGG